MMIEHIGLWVKDLEKMRVFYETYFNGESGPKYHNPNKQFTSYFLSFEAGARLELMTKPALGDSTDERYGFAHLAIKLTDKEAVDRLTQRFLDEGYQVMSGPRTTGDGYYESVILDPEGNQLELTC